MEEVKKKKSLFEMLRGRYPAGEYVLMSEVSDAAGYQRQRSADYMVMSLWPSRGCALQGIEVKSHRSDWLNELKKPEKAENIFQYCDQFWLLTTDDKVAKIEEIPITWGWMTVKGERIHVIKQAPALEPKQLTRTFIAAMMKRAADKTSYVHRDSIKDEIEAECQKRFNSKTQRLEGLENDYNKLNDEVDQFKKATGVDLKHFYRWETSATKLGEAVKLIDSGGGVQIEKDLLKLLTVSKELALKVEKHLQVIKAVNEFVIENTEQNVER